MSNPPRSFAAETPGRAVAFGLVVAGHIALLAGLANAGFSTERRLEKDPLQVALLAETVQAMELPPPPPPRFEPPRVEMIPPDVVIEWEREAPSNAISVSLERQPPAPPRSGSLEPLLVSEVEYLRPPRPSYPPAARKRRQEGLVVLRVLVDVVGRPAAVEVQDSSGFPLLDSAARDAVRQTQFRPHLENGVARPVLVLIPIEFGLRDRVASSSAD